jgi:hypothetical protein
MSVKPSRRQVLAAAATAPVAAAVTAPVAAKRASRYLIDDGGYYWGFGTGAESGWFIATPEQKKKLDAVFAGPRWPKR